MRLLDHPDADIRAWCVRLLGDEPTVPPGLAERLVGLAGREPDVMVRAQLASTARRLGPEPGLDVAYRILTRDLDGDDAHLPLLLWWAVEDKAYTGMPHALALFASSDAWRSSMVRSSILVRLMRRYALARRLHGG